MKRARIRESVGRVSQRVDAKRLWRAYRLRRNFRHLFIKTISSIFLFFILVFLFIMLFGRPDTPARGSLSFIVNTVLAVFSFFSMLVLLFFVVESTKSCLSLTHRLTDHHTIWPRKILAEFKDDSNLESDEFADLLDVRFITRLTESVGKLIYYPFIILAIMIAARTRYFDNWNFPYSLIFVYTVPLIYLISCAVGLQRSAKQARQKVLDNFREKLFEARFGPNENRHRALKINRLIREIESIQKGAFRPFMQNPVIHVLVGSGGAGLFAVLKLFLSS